MSKKSIMKRAHEIAAATRAKYGKRAHFGECLKQAWAEAKTAARRTPTRFRQLLKVAKMSLDEFVSMTAHTVRPSAQKRHDFLIREFYWGRVECPCAECFDALDRIVEKRKVA